MNPTIERRRMFRMENDLTRREFLVGAGLIALVPGCGSGGESGEGASANFRTIEHAMGETDVPAEPERVAAVAEFYLEDLVALGMKPAVSVTGTGEFPPHLMDDIEGVRKVGTTFEPNLEVISTVAPDLIIGMDDVHGEIYEELSSIAPTVLLFEPWRDWRKRLLDVGNIVGRRAMAEDALEEYGRTADEARARLREGIGGETAVFLRIQPQEIRIYGGGGGGSGNVLHKDLGIPAPEGVPMDEPTRSISPELLPEVDADHIFLLVQDEEGENNFRENPLWQRLRAVENDRVYPVDAALWVSSGGPLIYDALIEDIESRLLG